MLAFILVVSGGLLTLPPINDWTSVDYTFALMLLAVLIPTVDKLGKKNGNDSNKGPTLP
jgi:hypothetical protein